METGGRWHERNSSASESIVRVVAAGDPMSEEARKFEESRQNWNAAGNYLSRRAAIIQDYGRVPLLDYEDLVNLRLGDQIVPDCNPLFKKENSSGNRDQEVPYVEPVQSNCRGRVVRLQDEDLVDVSLQGETIPVCSSLIKRLSSSGDRDQEVPDNTARGGDNHDET